MGNKPQFQFTRRQLLTGRIWRLGKGQPRVMRYPKSRADVDGGTPTTNRVESVAEIQGISVEPVRVTEQAPESHRSSGRRPLPPLFRPPSAINEEQFLAGCTRCNACADACPHQAIVQASTPHRPDQANTPVIYADQQPCLMCEDFPCIAACEPQVLKPQIPKSMGTASITQHLCLAYHGTDCDVCLRQCPVAGAITAINGRPVVNEEVCSGCGVCRFVCPAPENAVLLMPMFQRVRVEG